MKGLSAVRGAFRPRWLAVASVVAAGATAVVVSSGGAQATPPPASNPAHPVVDAAWIYSQDWYNANPAAAAAIVKGVYNVDDAVAQQIVTLAPAGYVPIDDAIIAAHQAEADFFADQGLLKKKVTASAMFDDRKLDNPRAFNPDRPPSHYMLFGYGLHWCVGAYIAEAQITQTFKALLLKSNLRRAGGDAGKLRTFGPFPAHLTVQFDP